MRLLSIVLTFVVLHSSCAGAAHETESAFTVDTPSAEAHEGSETVSLGGGVILNGHFIAPPYRVVAVAEGVELNGHFVPEAGFNERARRRREDPYYISFVDRVGRRLDGGAWLLGWEEGEYGMLSEERISNMFYALSSDMSADEKTDELTMSGIQWIERADWQQLVKRCELPTSVLDHYGVSAESEVAIDPALAALVHAPEHRFQMSIYLLTVFGIGATVFALGTLLSYHPAKKMPWSNVNISKDATQLVLRSVILLIGLAVLDLVCTTMSSRTAGFWEVNPLGAVVLHSPLVLGSFKLGATFMSGSILFALRRYHGAQVASWWLALFCTVLAIRWVTFNSMFMAA